MSTRRPIRIGGASGGFTDRVAAIARLAQDPSVDAIVGDWLSENVMTGYGAGKASSLQSFSQLQGLGGNEAFFASTFLQCFEPAIDLLASNGIKLVINAGASDTERLAHACCEMVRERGQNLKVAWVEGDDVTEPFKQMASNGVSFNSLADGRSLAEWGFDPVCAQAYLGSWGIAEALKYGADIVVCGRVSDAGPTVGLAAWWHDWKPQDYDQLAGALMAGHLIECSAFVTGGYYSRFQDLMKEGKHLDLGFPIAEVHENGHTIISKERDSNGVVNIETVTSQLVYEISGPLYFNSDVAADLHNVVAEQIEKDQVLVKGITGLPPPPTTRCGVTAHGGYQAEWHFYLVGLDVQSKCRWMEEQARHAIGEDVISKFSMLKFHVHGTSPINPENQEVATVDLRVFAQAKDADLFDASRPDGFSRRLYETVLQSCPGVSRSNDLRQSATPKKYFEYWVTLIPQDTCRHRVHLLFGENLSLDIPSPTDTQTYSAQDSYDTIDPAPLESFGLTEDAPLGSIVLGRSGDKASDANVGFFFSNDEQWQWLRSFLSIERIKSLFGTDEYKGNRIDRFELKKLRAVHFLLKDHLDRGYNSGSSLDTLAKNLCEYIRAKVVPVPRKFLHKGLVTDDGRQQVVPDSPTGLGKAELQLSSKVIAVTGAASGIGLATSRVLASRGAKLSLADSSKDALERVCTQIASDFGVDVRAWPLDVREYPQVERWISDTVAHFGRLDGAANIAGVIPKSIGMDTIAEQDLDEWNLLFSVNVTGVMHCMKAQLQVMRDGGSIVNACSIAGVTGRAKNACYSATKHAVLGLTRSAAKEFGHRGIRVNCFCPGRITTPMSQTSMQNVVVNNPCSLGRDGRVEEVAKPVAFLLSDESTYISGIALGVDGGYVLARETALQGHAFPASD